MQAYRLFRPPLGLATIRWLPLERFAVPASRRSVRHQAFDAAFDQEQLAEARKWRHSFHIESLPAGNTSFSRSSGPGGQHVNKTETKATTTWPVSQLLGILPTLLHAGIRESKYYSRRSDCLSIQAQTQRSRSANTDDNRQKLFDELVDLYRQMVPGETNPEKAKKHEGLKKSANESRIKLKKQQSAKKASRKGSSD
ncbi:hypothetical protein C8A05DRAFT_18026 [Staphylotrichum tortipilum]|uniref:Prokaryotic-type class I peptide chain release factors domain-containing protein n=1 Tax=Staphylotrichum tortipilum TaxID=2831512 RepID=A0AAN6MEZ1_9PEZI|nr:hypothetical protein C8A05DRAFT_18026 [Staphylotrichum longicolle]